MQNSPLHIAVIVGSTREGRRGRMIARWFTDVAHEREDMRFALVDLAELDSSALSARIDHADGIVVVTPEYNHSFPAPLKEAIDSLKREWQAKPVAFVSYGGISGGLRAVEHLRGVFAELHATTIRDTVSFHNVGTLFGPDGKPSQPDACNAAARKMLGSLSWWAHTLREGRAARPYVA